MIEPVSPGEILQKEFMEPSDISAYRLAQEIHMPEWKLRDIINGKRAISPDTAMRFSTFFGTTAQFWLNLQNRYVMDKLELLDTAPYLTSIRPLETVKA